MGIVLLFLFILNSAITYDEYRAIEIFYGRPVASVPADENLVLYCPFEHYGNTGFLDSVEKKSGVKILSENLTSDPEGYYGKGVLVEGGINLLKNPSFEQKGGWSILNLDDTVCLFGKYSNKYTWNGNPASIDSDPIEVEPLTTYTLSGWVKKGFSIHSIYYLDLADIPEECNAFPVKFSDDWERLICTFTTAKERNFVKVRIVGDEGNFGPMWMDGIQLEKGSFASPFAGESPDLLEIELLNGLSLRKGTVQFWMKANWSNSIFGTLLEIYGTAENSAPNELISIYTLKANGQNLELITPSNPYLPMVNNKNSIQFKSIVGWKPGSWHHISFVWGKRVLVLVDGILALEMDSPPNLPLPQIIFIGSTKDRNDYLNATFDELKIFSREKSIKDVNIEYLKEIGVDLDRSFIGRKKDQ